MALLAAGDSNSSVTNLYRRTHMEQYGLALQKLQIEIADPAFRPSELHIQTIAWLIPQIPQTTRDADEPYPLSPLRNLQNLQAFAAFDLIVPHMNAMYYMVNIMGGIVAIKLNPMADILQMQVLS